MRKFIPFLFSGFAALSWCAMAADSSVDKDKGVRGDTNAVQGANAGANVRGDANPGVGTASDNAVSEKRGNEVHGATSDSDQKPGKQAERKKNKDNAGAGATGETRKY